ncbi:MAG: PaaI family thioesterase [Eggerthellaceae bacterium]|nr:PaaI family thioesterase [Eggerthellaceae bacterium]
MVELAADATIEEIREFFALDRFATNALCRIQEASRGHAVCTMQLTDDHRNAMGNVMGGAVFTLADFALAVACNVGEKPTVSIESDIKFLTLAKGDVLTATAVADRSGRHIGVYTITVTDEENNIVAIMTATTYR